MKDRSYNLQISVFAFGVLQARKPFAGNHTQFLKALAALEHLVKDQTGKVIREKGHPFFWNTDSKIYFKLQDKNVYFDRRAFHQRFEALKDSVFNFI